MDLGALTVSGRTLGEVLDVVGDSRRAGTAVRRRLSERDGVDPDDVILSPGRAAELGVTSTICFPRGNLAPEGSVIKSTAIDPRVLDADGVYRKTGPARVFTARAGRHRRDQGARPTSPMRPGDVLVLTGRGPLGSGMEEIFQLTSALEYLSWGREVAVLTDARFSGVSTGACIGCVAPEALAGGPLGKVRDGDRIRIVIDRHRLEGSVDLVGDAQRPFSPEEACRCLGAADVSCRASRPTRPCRPTRGCGPRCKRASGGPWGGCVFDVERIVEKLG